MSRADTGTTLETKNVTVSNAVKDIDDFSFTAAELELASRALITSRLAGVMFTTDGTDPTATLGHLIAEDVNYELLGAKNIRSLKLLREAAVDASVTITIERLTY